MNVKIRPPLSLPLMTVFLVTAGLSPVAAESPTPTPAPTQTPRPAGGTSLNEVAKDKELKGGEQGKAIVITNENLSDFAGKGSVTSVDGGDAPNRRPVRDVTKVDVVPPNDPAHTDERRRYWQAQYQRQVNQIGSIRNQITVIDEKIPGLWRDFYAWDDPMYRDGVIKPKLDEALAQRKHLEQQLADAEAHMSEIKDQARRDGAEPGWFRGIEMPTPFPATPTPDIVIR